MDKNRVEGQKKAFLNALPGLSGSIAAFTSINKRWGAAITAGMIEAGRMDQEAATLFTPLIQDMGSTKEKFRLIQDRLIAAILYEMVRKVVLELSETATFAINILKRNLYERTADVGYLATDSELQSLMALSPDDPDLAATAERMRARLVEYQAEYTVYDEIIALDMDGRVRVHLDTHNPVKRSDDPLLRQTLAVDPHATGDRYIETFRATDLRPGKSKALVYSQTILDSQGRRPVGVLCLCFDFEDEMRRIFADLGLGGAVAACILDDSGRVIASSDPSAAPIGSAMPLALEGDFDILTLDGREFLATTQKTDGYQGFYGLTWYGHAFVQLENAFTDDDAAHDRKMRARVDLGRISAELADIKHESDDILADMTLDGLNGQVKAAKFKADGFVEVLRFVNSLGCEIGGMFEESIAGLERTILSAYTHGLQFRAFRASNIADRNLYERADDVCWWALTPLFRETLARHGSAGLTDEERQALRESLQYINDLYTPYLRLVLADAQGVVVGVSDPPAGLDDRHADGEELHGQDFVGRRLRPELVQRALRLPSSRDYVVSPFEPTPLYGGRPTYVFATAVRDPHDDARVGGVMAIVFDAEPQLAAMLQNVLPRDERKKPLPGCFAVFAERSGRVIASTLPDLAVDEVLELPQGFLTLQRGRRTWDEIARNGRNYLAGCQVSAGYREYKVSDGYENDLLCVVGLPV